MSTKNVTYQSVELEVEFDYTPAEGDGWSDQHFDEDYAITAFLVGDVDISPMLTDDQLNDIEALLAEGE